MVRKITLYSICMLFISLNSFSQSKRIPAPCMPSISKADLDINNVRAAILVAGDMWWDLTDPIYEVPKGSGKNAIFMGALWLGGIDQNGQLHVAGQTYRQGGSDFWPGPLDTTDASTNQVECQKYDKLWKLNRQDVENFKNGGAATPEILSYPGNGNLSGNQAHYLAPFHDTDTDGIYDPSKGDYPEFDFYGDVNSCYKKLMGDQSIWWVFNDIGNTHTETHGNPLGFEIRAQAFAYSGYGHLDNTTFYQYQMINRSSNTYHDMYVGIFCDTDLGYAFDDFIGCDVSRGLAYSYNGDYMDEGSSGYGINPPAIGIDILEGPRADIGDGIDNNKNGVVDEAGEDITMSNFITYNSDMVDNGEPTTPTHYYNYLKGCWKDGSSLTYGGIGYKGTTPCNYMYPAQTDPLHGTLWTEFTAGNSPTDRRFLTSAGAFTMAPGAVNYMTAAVIWARATSGGNLASINHLKVASDDVQAFFNSCFQGVGIYKSEQELDELSVFPNPFHDKCSIRFNNDRKNEFTFALYSLDGKKVFQVENITQSEIEINRGTLPDGIYIYHLKDKNGKYKQGKLIVY